MRVHVRKASISRPCQAVVWTPNAVPTAKGPGRQACKRAEAAMAPRSYRLR